MGRWEQCVRRRELDWAKPEAFSRMTPAAGRKLPEVHPSSRTMGIHTGACATVILFAVLKTFKLLFSIPCLD